MTKGREKVFYLLSAAVMMLVLFAPGWAKDKFLFGLDTFTLHLPFLLYAKKIWAVFHDMPLWMPDIYMGMPAIDASNLMFFYPTNLLSVILPVPAGQFYLIDLIIHMTAAGFGMFIFLRRHDMEKNAAWFGAFVYMLSGPLVTAAYNGHWPDIKGMALAPYVFYFVNRGINSKSAFLWLSAGLFMALQVLGLGMQIAVYTYAGVFLYAAYMLYTAKAGKKKIAGSVIFFAAATAAVALFSAPQFFPAQDYMKFSWRKYFDYGEFINFSFNPGESVVMLLPQFFGLKDGAYWGFSQGTAISFYCGLLPFLLAPFALAEKKHRNMSVFFMALGGLFLIMSFGGNTPLYRLLYHVPVFNKFRNPARAMCMLPLIFAFISAAGLSALAAPAGTAEEKNNKRTLINVLKAAGIMAGALLLVAVWDDLLKETVKAVFAGVRQKIAGRPMTADELSASVGFIRQDAVNFALVCAMFALFAWLKTSNRIKSTMVFCVLLCFVHFYDMWRLEKKFISYRTVGSIAGNNGAADLIRSDSTLFRTADFGFSWFPNRSIYYGAEFFTGFHAILTGKMYNLLGNEVYKYPEMLRLFNIKYYLNTSDPEEYKDRDLEKVLDGPVKLFIDKKAMPRVFLTDRVKKFKDDDEILSYMKTGSFDPWEALVKDDVALAESPHKLAASAVIQEYSPNRIRIRAVTNRDSMLVLSNAWYYRWKVIVDKKQEKIYNIDYVINGVRLAAGNHDVEFYYDRTPVILCILLMLAAFLAYAALYMAEKRKGSNNA